MGCIDLRECGLNPEQAPKTWREIREAANKIKQANAAPIPYATAWPTWVHYENFSAIHNVPLAKRFATYVIGMTGGNVVYQGTPDGLTDAHLKTIYGGEDWLD